MALTRCPLSSRRDFGLGGGTVEVASEYKIAPKDAMHILYAKGRAEDIVTTDKGFLAALNAKDKSVFPRDIKTKRGSKPLGAPALGTKGSIHIES